MKTFMSARSIGFAFLALMSASAFASEAPAWYVQDAPTEIKFKICFNSSGPEPRSKGTFPRSCFERTMSVGPASSLDSGATANFDLTYGYPNPEPSTQHAIHLDVKVEANWVAPGNPNIVGLVEVRATELTKRDGPEYLWFVSKNQDGLGLPNVQRLSVSQSWGAQLSTEAPQQTLEQRYFLAFTRVP